MLKKRCPHTFLLFLAVYGSLFLAAPLPGQAQSDLDTSIFENPAGSGDRDADDPPALEEEESGVQRFNDLRESDSLLLQQRGLPPGYSDDLRKDGDFWYAGRDFRKKEVRKRREELPPAKYTPFMQRSWVQTLLWIIIIGGFIAAIIWYLVDNNAGLFRKRNKIIEKEEEGADQIPEDIFAIGFRREIDKALARGDYRLAIRLHFLQMLKTLAEKQLIAYKQDKTNLDYLIEMAARPFYPDFFRLTRHFEYSWYGLFDVKEEVYRQIAGEFRTFENQLHA